MQHPKRLATALLTLFTLACAAVPDERFEDPPEWVDAPRFEAVVDFEIASSDEAGPYLFSQIYGLALDSEGRIYLAEALADEIRVFDANGAHLYSIGRTGSGPGELKGPCCLAFDAGGRLWVRDRGNARYNGYELDDAGARHIATVRMAHGDGNFGPPLTFSAAGHLIDIGHKIDGRGGESKLHRFHLDTAGTAVATEVIRTLSMEEQGGRAVTRREDGGASRLFIRPAFPRTQLLAHAPGGGRAEMISDRYEVAWYESSDATSPPTLSHTLRRHLPLGPPVSAAEREAAEERLRQEAEWAGLAGGTSPFSVPDRKQPLAALFFDQDGRLWVQRATAAGEPSRADLYSPDGTPAAEVTWPRGVVLSNGAIRGDRAVGIAYNEVGVPRIVVLRLERL